jgi:hypothetical protein
MDCQLELHEHVAQFRTYLEVAGEQCSKILRLSAQYDTVGVYASVAQPDGEV